MVNYDWMFMYSSCLFLAQHANNKDCDSDNVIYRW